MQKIRFVINPISGSGNARQLPTLISRLLDKKLYESEIIFTEGRGHATELTKEAANKAYEIVVAVGGDGTVNEVGKALINSSTALGIIPRGSGNGLANHLNISHSIEKAIATINNNKKSAIDTLSINDQFCLGIAGIGFDAHVAHEFAKAGKRGLATYTKVIFSEYGKFNPINFSLKVNGENLSRKALLITFANSSEYGNKAKIAPFADIRDGLMEVCILKKIPAFKTPFFAFRLFKNKSHTSTYLETIKTDLVEIQNYDLGLIHIDGEPERVDRNITIKVNPLSLKVLIP